MGNDQAARTVLSWRKDPVLFISDNFGVELDAWQRDAVEAFASDDSGKRRISLQACAGPGKSAVMAWCIWWFMSVLGEKGEHPRGIAVSVTYDNLKDNLWAELAKWQSRSKYLMKAFRWTKEQVFSIDHPQTWFMSARSWNKDSNAEEQGKTLSGLHSKYVLVAVDESGGIPISIMKSAEQALGNCAWGKIIQAGNPLSLDGMLYAASVTYRDKWHVIKITGDPEDIKRSPRISKEWAESQILEFGRSDPWVMAYILGQFPPSSINSLLSVEEVELAMSRGWKESEYQYSQKRIGVDVARGGMDRTVLFPRQGLMAMMPVVMRGVMGPGVAARLMQMKNDFKSEVELIDDTGGFGSSVIDSALLAGMEPMGINFSSSANSSRYYNRRSEMWLEMAAWIRRGGALPKVEGLRKELTSPTYVLHNGKFRLEEKEQIKKRLGWSPDYADALALTFGIPEAMRSDFEGGYVTNSGYVKAETNYDPFRGM